MTLFEYISVAISIVLSLSVAQILVNLRAVFRRDIRYWVHASWVIILIYIHIIVWWGFWAYQEVESWNLIKFGLVLFNPGVLFVATTALVTDRAKTQSTWEQHFFESRRSFFLIFLLLPVGAVLRNWVLIGLPIIAKIHIPDALMTTIAVIGLACQSRRVHTVLAITAIFLMIAVTVFFYLQPGAGRVFEH